MFLTRHKRAVLNLGLLAVVGSALWVIPMEKRAHGTFEVRPLTRRDVRAPVAGFVREVHVEEGEKVASGQPAARLEIPDLDSRIAQKEAEVREVEASLQLLVEGPRQEEIDEQKKRVARAIKLRDLAERDLARASDAMEKELNGLKQKIKQIIAEVEQAKATYSRTKRLFEQQFVSAEQHEIDRKRVEVAIAIYKQTLAEIAERKAQGTTEAEQNLALRKKELADEFGALELLQAGSRIGKIDAEKAELARLQEELDYMRELQKKLVVNCGWNGVVVTPHVQEAVGQYVNEGDLILSIEEVADLKVEIKLPEQELRDVEPGQQVELKARALPYDTFTAEVNRIAPSATEGEVQSSVVVHTKLDNPPEMLRPGMTGYARITCGSRPAGEILLDSMLQYVRTEFWW